MNLILSDINLKIDLSNIPNTQFIDLSSLKISSCAGCFGCWIKTPGKCVIRDDAVKVYPLIAESENIIYISKTYLGGYDSVMKTMLERAIPVQKAFIRILDGETHHIQRNVALKNAVIIAYGDIDQTEKEVFKKLVERNAKNMNFKEYKILFVSSEDVEKSVQQEVKKWEK